MDKDMGLKDEEKDRDLEPRTKPRTKTWNQGQGQKLKAKTKDVQMSLLQRHITVNCSDFNRILHILYAISSTSKVPACTTGGLLC